MTGESVEGKAGVVVAKVPWPAGGSVCAPWILCFFSFFSWCSFVIVCGRLLNIAVPGPLEQSLFRRSGVLNFNLSCNSLLEEVLVGMVGIVR